MQIKFNVQTGEIIGYAIIGSLGSISDNDILIVNQPDDLTNFEESYEVVNRILTLKDTSDRDSALLSRHINTIRSRRNMLLTESDWRMVSDYQGSDQEAWKTYRQNLRDIPQGISKVEDVVFPAKP